MRKKISALLLAAFSLLSLVNLCWNQFPRGDWRVGDDAVTAHERRFAKLRSSLPRDVTTVGYVSDPKIIQGDVAATKQYVLTIYALAPLVVDTNTEHRYVVGNSTAMSRRLPENPQLIMVRDFGDGVFLFRRDDK
jgi:hypothetical protein